MAVVIVRCNSNIRYFLHHRWLSDGWRQQGEDFSHVSSTVAAKQEKALSPVSTRLLRHPHKADGATASSAAWFRAAQIPGRASDVLAEAVAVVRAGFAARRERGTTVDLRRLIESVVVSYLVGAAPTAVLSILHGASALVWLHRPADGGGGSIMCPNLISGSPSDRRVN